MSGWSAKAYTVVAAVFAATTWMTQPAAAANPYDGDWSVFIQTTDGKCGTYRAAVQISNGQVASQPGDYAVSGTISTSGATNVTVINEEGSATGTGRLQGTAGTGKWRSSSGQCAGIWSATRRQ